MPTRWVLGSGFWVLGSGCWVLGAGYSWGRPLSHHQLLVIVMVPATCPLRVLGTKNSKAIPPLTPNHPSCPPHTHTPTRSLPCSPLASRPRASPWASARCPPPRLLHLRPRAAHVCHRLGSARRPELAVQAGQQLPGQLRVPRPAGGAVQPRLRGHDHAAGELAGCLAGGWLVFFTLGSTAHIRPNPWALGF